VALNHPDVSVIAVEKVCDLWERGCPRNVTAAVWSWDAVGNNNWNVASTALVVLNGLDEAWRSWCKGEAMAHT
jgi:hypothetical protein